MLTFLVSNYCFRLVSKKVLSNQNKAFNKTSFAVKNALSEIFGRLGIPQIVIADNMPFNSYELRDFSQLWNFKIQTTSPNYPQANGLAEKGVGIAKKMIKKSLESGVDLNLSLLNYRNSAVAGLVHSPAQLLMSRVLRSKLPLPSSRLEPQVINHQNIASHMKMQRDYQKFSYDKRCRTEPKEFKVNDKVYVQDTRTKHWKPAVIVEATGAPRSYVIKTEDGNKFRRNAFYLRERIVYLLEGEGVWSYIFFIVISN